MLKWLWPVPIMTAQFKDANRVNAVLASRFQSMRMAQGGDQLGLYNSAEDLITTVPDLEFQELVKFFASTVQNMVQQVNREAWPDSDFDLELRFDACWFQIQNSMAYHDTHTHANCAWSGVYYVQIDPAEQRHRHAVLSAANGTTRFYGPYTQSLAGANLDISNAYLHHSELEIQPCEGMLVVFPSYLPHKATPYEGDLDRIVVSFNASVDLVTSSSLV